ncbi:hypothetical protein BPORC_1123 [Bifidobacterium porcinum]|nr:hypothetical protein BPORC_1123 [Bifidobacterium porcinum]
MMELMLALVLAPSVLWVLRRFDSVRVIGAIEGVHDGGAGAVSGALRVLFGLSTHNADCAILHSRSFPRISLSVRVNRCDVPCCAAHILWAQVAQTMRLAGGGNGTSGARQPGRLSRRGAGVLQRCVNRRLQLSAISVVLAGLYLAYLCSRAPDTRSSIVGISRAVLAVSGVCEHK